MKLAKKEWTGIWTIGIAYTDKTLIFFVGQYAIVWVLKS